MLHGEETKRIFDALFERNKDCPKEWATMAQTLRTAADVLLNAHRQTWGDPDSEPLHPEYGRLDDPASMLYGCALENMVKGYLIKKHGGFEQARKKYGGNWDRHHLLKLAEATNLPLSNDQKLLLRSLEAFIVWAGRYPVSMKAEKYTIEKQHMCGDHLTPNAIHPDDIALLEPFYAALDAQIYAEFYQRKNHSSFMRQSTGPAR